MFNTKPGLIEEIRNRFAHVATCPEVGERIFFENAGGALTLKSVVETSTRYAAIPDNQGRANEMSADLARVIKKCRADAMRFLNASNGKIFIGESGTEVLFRMIMNAVIETPHGSVLGSTLEHPASRSACQRWAKIAGKEHIQIPHDDATGSIEAEAYANHVTPDTQVATIVHTSPVTGMAVDVAAVAKAIRAVAPDCFIIVDGIQHAAHGGVDINAFDIDGYAISPYKVFSRHGYGIGWTSDRLTALPHDCLVGGPEGNWELGTRDTGAYATFSDVVDYLEWLGSQFSTADDKRERIEAASRAIHAHEQSLTDAMLHGIDNLKGLADFDGVHIVGGIENPRREGLVTFYANHVPAVDIVAKLEARGIRVHIRKADHYSGNILIPLGVETCVRVSMCHYNTVEEISRFLEAMRDILSGS